MIWIFAFLSALFFEQQMVYALSSYSRNSGRRRLYAHSTSSFASTISQSIKNKVLQPSTYSASLSSSPELIQNLIETTSTNTTDQLNGLNNDIIQQPPPPTTKTVPELYNVDVRYNRRYPLTYDEATGRYLDVTSQIELSSDNRRRKRRSDDDYTIIQHIRQFLHSAFVPEGVSDSYYRFMKWRILQRFVNANVHVIGTQSLLMGLRGMQKSTIATSAAKGGAVLGAAAATNWVLKDTLGKVVRMAWASKMGRKFDPDAKRWRFRASLIYALGNGLEVSTYLHPQYFLVLAMLANSCKQMSMLTSSATRNALYNSFKKVETSSSSSANSLLANGTNTTNSSTTATTNRRGSGGSENIGDITAKGEAQIAVVDLLGIASGICLSRAVGISVQNVLTVWIILQIAEIFCMYHEMRAIAYKTFNFERMYTVLGQLKLDEDDASEVKDQVLNGIGNEHHKFSCIPTPEQIAAKEKVFLPPDHLARRAIAFGSPGRSALDPEELDMLINDVFKGEKYFLVVGQDLKNQRGLSSWVRQWMRRRKTGCTMQYDPQEQCHIVLHADANNLDILKSALALVILRKKLVKKVKEVDSSDCCDDTSSTLRSRYCMDVLRDSRRDADEIFPQLLRELTKQGWRPPLRSMLGRVSARAEWTIRKRSEKTV